MKALNLGIEFEKNNATVKNKKKIQLGQRSTEHD